MAIWIDSVPLGTLGSREVPIYEEIICRDSREILFRIPNDRVAPAWTPCGLSETATKNQGADERRKVG